MGIEIERKFLVKGTPWTDWGPGTPFKQGYLSRGEHATTRVRLAGAQGVLTIKGRTDGVSRLEYEYSIPSEDVEELLALCEGGVIEKHRWFYTYGAHVWEVDVFEGENSGLVIAEIELSHPDDPFERPPWLGGEVSHDHRYFNGALSRHPWSAWGRPQET